LPERIREMRDNDARQYPQGWPIGRMSAGNPGIIKPPPDRNPVAAVRDESL